MQAPAKFFYLLYAWKKSKYREITENDKRQISDTQFFLFSSLVAEHSLCPFRALYMMSATGAVVPVGQGSSVIPLQGKAASGVFAVFIPVLLAAFGQ